MTLVNDRLNTEVDRASASLSDRKAGIEGIVQSQSATPATTSVQSPFGQEDFAQLESRIETRFQAFTHEVAQLREELAHSVQGQNKHLKEWTRAKLTHVTSQVKGLRSFASHVETFVRERCSQESGAQALEATLGQGDEEAGDNGRAWPADRTAAASSSSTRPPTYLQIPELPRVSPPDIPTSTTQFSTIQKDVRAGAIRIEISDPEQWSTGDIAILKNQEAKRVRDIGSLIFETPIQHDYEAGVEVRSLLSSELVEETDGKLAVTDVDPSGNRFVKFVIDDVPSNLAEETAAPFGGDPVVTRSSHSQFTVPPFPFLAEKSGEQAPLTPERRERPNHGHTEHSKGVGHGSPGFGAGVSVYLDEAGDPTGLTARMESPQYRSHQARPQLTPRIPPEDNVPKDCSLLSMEPL